MLQWQEFGHGGSSTVYHSRVLIPLYTEMSSLQGVGVEGFHCIQRCPHSGCWNRGIPLYTEVSSLLGVLINRGVPLYTEVSSLQGVGIEGFHCIQRCPHFRVLE